MHDIVIIGGGITGMLAARILNRHRLSCLVLEAGPLKRKLPAHQAAFMKNVAPLTVVDENDWRYRSEGIASEWFRVRAAGGRSLLWGGWCVRPDEQNWRDAKRLKAPWPVSYEELQSHVRRVERLLNVRTGRQQPQFKKVTQALDLEIAPKRAALSAGGHRAATALDWGQKLSVRPHSVAQRIVRDHRGRASGVQIIDTKSKQTKIISARAVLSCASTIETTRLLLASDLNLGGLVGEGLVDHLITSFLVIEDKPPPSLALPGPLDIASVVPRFVNLGRQRRRSYRGGFSVELRGPMPLSHLPEPVLKVAGVDQAAAKSLSCYFVHSMGEAVPSPKRRVTLDQKERDGLGRPIPVVQLGWADEDIRMAADMYDTGVAIADALLPDGGRVIPVRDPERIGAIAHEAGTCRMGRSKKTSVTDPYGAVWGVPGLFVGDASVMPTVLDRHPTLSLLALTSRTADRIAELARHAC